MGLVIPNTFTAQQQKANLAVGIALRFPILWTQGYNAVFGDSDPAQVVADMLTNAVIVFSGSAAMAAEFNAAGMVTQGVAGITDGSPYPTSPPAPYTFAPNADGSGTLTKAST